MNKGFTLIELLVAIAIGMLAVGFSSVALNNFNEKQKLESVLDGVISNLRLARNYAVTNQFPDNSSTNTDRVAVTISSDGIMTAGTQTSGNQNTGYTFFSNDVTSSNGTAITFNGSDGGNVIRFSVTDGRLIGGTASVVVFGSDKKIKIDESGLIYEE